jgi:hypothetical protein
MSGERIEQVLITCVVFCLAASMLFFIDWLRRRRLAAKLRNANPTAPLSLPFSIEFTSTVDDLLQAYEAKRISLLSRDFRWAHIVMGWGWVTLAIVAWLKVFPRVRADKWWQPLIPLTLGAGLLWYNVAEPFFRKRRIQANNPTSQKLHLDFVSDGIQIQAEGIGTFKRTWDELGGVINAKQGLLMYFTDGIVNWLSQRVFQNPAEKEALFSFLYDQIPLVEQSEQESEHSR